MATEPGDLRSALIEVRAARQRLADVPGRVTITPDEFRAALRTRYPEYPWPEPRLISGSPDDLPWPDNCGAWAYLSLDIYAVALDEAAAGNTAAATFHEAEASWALGQATACLQLGF